MACAITFADSSPNKFMASLRNGFLHFGEPDEEAMEDCSRRSGSAPPPRRRKAQAINPDLETLVGRSEALPGLYVNYRGPSMKTRAYADEDHSSDDSVGTVIVCQPNEELVSEQAAEGAFRCDPASTAIAKEDVLVTVSVSAFRNTFVHFSPPGRRGLELTRSSSAPNCCYAGEDSEQNLDCKQECVDDADYASTANAWDEFECRAMSDIISDDTTAESSARSESDQQSECERSAACPKLQALIDEYEAKSITTMMVCRIPSRFGKAELLGAIHTWGLEGAYDLVFLPCRRGEGNNFGYGFVNFKTPKSAAEFAYVSDNASFPNCETQKLCYTKPATCQGYEANLEMHTHKARMAGVLSTFR